MKARIVSCISFKTITDIARQNNIDVAVVITSIRNRLFDIYPDIRNYIEKPLETEAFRDIDNIVVYYKEEDKSLSLGKWSTNTLKDNDSFTPELITFSVSTFLHKVILFLPTKNLIKNKGNENRLQESEVPVRGRDKSTGLIIKVTRVCPKVKVGQIENGTSISCK